MRTKSYRRHKQFYKFKRRADLWYHWLSPDRKTEFWEQVKKGEYSWLRTTGRPCNCYSCTTYRSYIRPSKSEVKKIIDCSFEE